MILLCVQNVFSRSQCGQDVSKLESQRCYLKLEALRTDSSFEKRQWLSKIMLDQVRMVSVCEGYLTSDQMCCHDVGASNCFETLVSVNCFEEL